MPTVRSLRCRPSGRLGADRQVAQVPTVRSLKGLGVTIWVWSEVLATTTTTRTGAVCQAPGRSTMLALLADSSKVYTWSRASYGAHGVLRESGIAGRSI